MTTVTLAHASRFKEANADSMLLVCMVKASTDSFFIELSTVICFMSVLLARAKIFTIYWRSGIAILINKNLHEIKLLSPKIRQNKHNCTVYNWHNRTHPRKLNYDNLKTGLPQMLDPTNQYSLHLSSFTPKIFLSFIHSFLMLALCPVVVPQC